MKAKKHTEAHKLEDIPNIGKSIANDLRGLGIFKPTDLCKKNALKLYQLLNETTGVRHDPCVLDTFMAAVDFMNGGKARPWWDFTKSRKQMLAKGPKT